jgi:ribosomal protein S19
MKNNKSLWKSVNVNFKKLTNKNKIYSRQFIIPSFLIGKSVKIYNGINFIKIYISRDKIGFKFGDFVFTRKKSTYKKK